MKKNIAVFFGGKNSEHDISIISGVQALNELDKSKYNIFPVYIDQNGKWYCSEKFFDINYFKNFEPNSKDIMEVAILPSYNFLFVKKKAKFKAFKRIDVALVVMHGINGEDGSLQGLLELSNIPYTSSGILASALTMDKVAMKQMFKALEVPNLDFKWFFKGEYLKHKEDVLNEIESAMEYPLIVKPARLGSSIGITICKNRDELINAIEVAIHYDTKFLVEKALINFKEVNISVRGNRNKLRLSKTEEPKNFNKLLSFEDKYMADNNSKISNGMTDLKRKIPADIDEEMTKQVKEIAVKVFRNFNTKGIIRIDFLIDLQTNSLFINEINNIPGSLAFYLYDKKYSELLDEIIRDCEEEFDENQCLTLTFKSAVLNKSNLKLGIKK